MDNIIKIKWVYFFKSFFFFMPILTLFYFSKGLNTFQVVSLEGFLIIGLLLAEIPTGIIADKLSRKFSMIMLLITYIVGNIWTIFANNYIEFIFIEILFGIGLAFGSGSIEALVYDSLKHQKREKEMSKEWGSINFYMMIASVISAAIGGYIARSHDPKTFIILLWLYNVGSIIALIITFTIKERAHTKKVEKEDPLLLFKGAVSHILKTPKLRKILLTLVFTTPFMHVLLYLFQPYFQLAQVPNIMYGFAMSLALLLGAFFTKYAYKIEEKLGTKKTFLIATIIPGILYIIMALIINPLFSFLTYILLKGISQLRNPIFSEYQNKLIKSHNRATVLSVISMMVSLYLAGMRFIIGWIAQINLLLSFVVMGVIIIVGAITFRIKE